MRRVMVGVAVAVLLLTGCSAGEREAPSLLAAHGLAGKSVVAVIDHLDRLAVAERPATLKASVRPGELVLSGGTQEERLGIPADKFYLSVAPYADRTHECFFHSLTSCKGEIAGKSVRVRIADASGTVLVDEERTTFDNGFVGFWLPRDIEGTLRITHDGRSAETRFTTGPEAPTCLTTLRLA